MKDLCDKIIAMKPDLVVSEKGISDLAIHFLQKANISAIRRYSTIRPLQPRYVFYFQIEIHLCGKSAIRN